jgi:integration host factor subunit alpha
MSEFFVESLETPSLTKAMLAESLNENLGLNVREAKDMVDSVFELMSATLISGEDVKLSGFGNFQIRAKATRPGRNPKTGEAVTIQPRRVATFRASNALKELIDRATSPAD